MNNEARKIIQAHIETLKVMTKEVRKLEKAEGKSQAKIPRNLQKAGVYKTSAEFYLDDAACCIEDAFKLLKKAAK